MQVIQYRATTGAQFETDTENRRISGYGIVFNSDSQPLHIFDGQRGFVEVIEQIKPESLRETDMSDVISAFNHDFDKVLGRTSSGTMKLTRDAKGILYRLEAPETSYANDVLALLKRGDLSGSSFVFTMDFEEGFEIEERGDKLIASPKKITKIYEMGPVVTPAYPETTAENRSHMSALENAVKRHLTAKEEAEKRNIDPDLVGEETEPIEEKREEENTDITYPLVVTYKTKAKVMKAKNKRV